MKSTLTVSSWDEQVCLHVRPGLAKTPLHEHVPAKTHNLVHIIFGLCHFQLHNFGKLVMYCSVCHSTPTSMVLKVSPLLVYKNCIKNKFTVLKIHFSLYIMHRNFDDLPQKSQCLMKALNGTLLITRSLA